MPRAKCPICGQSTETSGGACEFCGHELEREIVEEAKDRARRLASTSTLDTATRPKPAQKGTIPRTSTPPEVIASKSGAKFSTSLPAPDSGAKELHDAVEQGMWAFVASIVSWFTCLILAVIANRLAANSIAVHKKYGLDPPWTAVAGWWISMAYAGLFFLLVTAWIALITLDGLA